MGQDTGSVLLANTNRPITAARMTLGPAGGPRAISFLACHLSPLQSGPMARMHGEPRKPAKAFQLVGVGTNVQTKPNC